MAACHVGEQLTSRPASLSLRQTSYAFTPPCSLITMAFRSPLPRTCTHTATAVKLPAATCCLLQHEQHRTYMHSPRPAVAEAVETPQTGRTILLCPWAWKNHSSSIQAYTRKPGASHCCASQQARKQEASRDGGGEGAGEVLERGRRGEQVFLLQ